MDQFEYPRCSRSVRICARTWRGSAFFQSHRNDGHKCYGFGHRLYPGIVTRTLEVVNGNYVVTTYGVGNGALPGPNDWLSNWVWGANVVRLARETVYEETNGVAFPPPECFPAHTPIAISLTQTRPISDIRIGDTVLAFDPAADLGRGALVPRKVVRLYRNTTDEWVKLTWAEGGEAKELIATPGHMTENAGAKATAEASQGSGPSNLEILGETCWLYSQSNSRRGWPIGSIQRWLLPAILTQQVRVYRKNGKPHAFVIWAFLSKAVEEALVLNTNALQPKDWQSGKRIWLIDWVAPSGGTRQMTRDLKHNVFLNDLGRFLEAGGARKAVVPDTLKSAVFKADRSDPGLNRSYVEMAAHYRTAILSARPYTPRDKAKVEVAVQAAQRWILAGLRNRRFFSLVDLNAAIRRLLEELNMRVMRGYGASRADLFATLDPPQLQPFPPHPYEFAHWKRAPVAPGYHVEVDSYRYSVPFRLIREAVDVRVCGIIVEIFHKGQRVASHPRCPGRRSHVTLPDHMQSAHRRHAA